jgi:hypothetical protein
LRSHLDFIDEESFKLIIIATLSICEEKDNYYIIFKVLFDGIFPLLYMILLHHYIDRVFNHDSKDLLGRLETVDELIRVFIILLAIKVRISEDPVMLL